MTDTRWNSEDERLLWADACHDSFWHFAREAYGIAHNPKGSWLTPRIHKPLCDWFEMHVKEWLKSRAEGRRGQKHLMILVPREFGKTTLITNAGMLWLHILNPEISTYIGSENKDKAVQFLQPLKSVISGDDPYARFTWLYGNWFHKDRMWTNESVVHAARTSTALRDPSFGVWGVATGLTGVHPDAICLDDPISYERLESDSGWLHTVNEHVDSLIPVLLGDGLRILVGTRYADGDHLGSLLRTLGAKSISGMSYPEADPKSDGVFDVYYLSGRDLNRNPVFPEVWNEDRLKEFEKRNSLKYYAQIENSPGVGAHVPLYRRQVDQLWVAPKDVPKNLRISIHIDTAFKYRERIARGDSSVIEKWGHARDGSGDVYFLGGWGSDSWRIEQFNDKLVMVLQEMRSTGKWPFILTDEQEVGGKAGTWELTIQSACHAKGLPRPNVVLLNRGGKRKLTRMMEAASFWVDGHVKLVENAPGVEMLISQMLKIGIAEHDDWADAAADVFHKQVYTAQRLIQTEEQPDIVRPYDEFLQPGRLTYADLRRRALEDRYRPMPIE